MHVSFASPQIGQGVATERQTCLVEVKLWLAAVTTLMGGSSMMTLNWRRGIASLCAVELSLEGLKHTDSCEFARIEDLELFLRSVM